MYEIYDKPSDLSYEHVDAMMMHAMKVLSLNAHIVIVFAELETGVCGYCDYEDGEITVTIGSNLCSEDLSRTLFHELVHGQQFLDGRIDFRSTGEISYYNLPWEIEAYTLEETLWFTFDPMCYIIR